MQKPTRIRDILQNSTRFSHALFSHYKVNKYVKLNKNPLNKQAAYLSRTLILNFKNIIIVLQRSVLFVLELSYYSLKLLLKSSRLNQQTWSTYFACLAIQEWWSSGLGVIYKKNLANFQCFTILFLKLFILFMFIKSTKISFFVSPPPTKVFFLWMTLR